MDTVDVFWRVNEFFVPMWSPWSSQLIFHLCCFVSFSLCFVPLEIDCCKSCQLRSNSTQFVSFSTYSHPLNWISYNHTIASTLINTIVFSYSNSSFASLSPRLPNRQWQRVTTTAVPTIPTTQRALQPTSTHITRPSPIDSLVIQSTSLRSLSLFSVGFTVHFTGQLISESNDHTMYPFNLIWDICSYAILRAV